MEPWELAAKEGKTVVGHIVGPMIGVYYPYRKTGDLYTALNGEPIYCAKCDNTFEGDFLEHVTNHNKMKKKYPGFIVDSSLINKD